MIKNHFSSFISSLILMSFINPILGREDQSSKKGNEAVTIIKKNQPNPPPVVIKKKTTSNVEDDSSLEEGLEEGGGENLKGELSYVSDDKDALSLEQVMILAQNHAYTQKISNINKEITTRQKGTVVKSLFPSLTVNGSYIKSSPTVNESVGQCDPPFCPQVLSKKGDITLNQPITDILIGLQRVRAYSVREVIDEQNHLKTLREAQFNGASSYINVQQSNQMLDIAHANYNLAKKQARDAKLLYEAGKIARHDYLKFDLSLSQATKGREEAMKHYEIASDILYETLGIPRDQKIKLSKNYNSFWEHKENPPFDLEEVKSRIGNREDIKIASSHTLLQKRLHAIKVLDYLPKVSFFGQYQRDFTATNEIFPPNITFQKSQIQDNLNFGFKLTWTIWDWGVKLDAMNEAQSHIRKAQFEEELAKSQARIDMSRNYLQLRSSLQNLKTSKVSVHTAREVYKATKAKFMVGQATATDLIFALRDLTESRASLANSRSSLDMAFFMLKRSLGEDLLEAIQIGK
jgi:outer membrane protein TolC